MWMIGFHKVDCTFHAQTETFHDLSLHRFDTIPQCDIRPTDGRTSLL